MSYSVHIRGPTGRVRNSGPKLIQMAFWGENEECCSSVVGDKKRQIGSDNWKQFHALISTGKMHKLVTPVAFFKETWQDNWLDCQPCLEECFFQIFYSLLRDLFFLFSVQCSLTLIRLQFRLLRARWYCNNNLPISVCLSIFQETALKPSHYGTLCGTGTARSHRIKINL